MRDNEVIWITGASSGIGEAFTRALAHHPVKLALSARSEDTLRNLAEEINTSGKASAYSFPLDVLQKEANLECAKRIEEHFGAPVSIFVPCAGTYVPSDSLHNYNSEEHEKLMRLNYFAQLYGIEAVLPRMKELNYGQIVGVSSLVGYFGLPRAVGYSASKAAVINALQSLRFELRSTGVQVKVINPGFVETPLTDKNDFKMPFLISAEKAAEHMVKSLSSSRFETHFPLSLSLWFKFLRLLPQPVFEWFVTKVVYRGEVYE